MKIKTIPMEYDKAAKLAPYAHKKPVRPNLLFRTIVRLVGASDLRDADFTYTTERMELAGSGPYLILMNHSSFIDLEIVAKVMYPKPYCIVCTSDGFVGKEWLMRQIGCIPTNKFVSDVSLISDMRYALGEKKCSVLMYPEASYSFDGTATPLPRKLGVLLKRLDVPVVGILTEGAFTRDPLYNCLQKRKVKVSATVKCLLTREEIKEKPVAELDAILDKMFSFDNFAWQRDHGVETHEPFRADGLNRILYQCAACGEEGGMEGKGTHLTCRKCGRQWELDELGQLHALQGETRFSHIPDWYAWERQNVRKALEDGSYRLDTDVDIGMLVDFKGIYTVGSGHLTHTKDGFVLDGCDGKLHFEQGPGASYSLYADYFWYEIGDVICIGSNDVLYYCFPKMPDVAARTRLATEELYKMYRAAKKKTVKVEE